MEHADVTAPPLGDDIYKRLPVSSFTDKPRSYVDLSATMATPPGQVATPQIQAEVSPSDPLVVLGFDIVYEIISYLQVGDILNLQGTSRTWYRALGGCKSLWRKRIEAAVSAKRMRELDETIRSKAANGERDGKSFEPFELSNLLRTTCKCMDVVVAEAFWPERVLSLFRMGSR